MPTYMYECEACKALTEVVCKMSDMKREINCEKCGKIADQVISNVNVIVEENFFSTEGKFE